MKRKFLDSIKEPLVLNMVGPDFCLVDNGFIWLQLLPENKNYCLTCMINREREIVQWYFDITNKNNINAEEVPARNEVQCGNYRDLSLFGAQEFAKAALNKGFSLNIYGEQ